MISVLIVGKGNVATHLYDAFSKIESIQLNQISSRNLVDLPAADVTILAVSDNAIASVSSKVNNSFVVHTSGVTPLNTLQNPNRKGVFYPLQTFSKGKKVNFNEVPFCLEATNTKDYELLVQLANCIETKVYNIDSEKRKVLHVAAVFVNNFTNHLYKIGDDICKKNNIPFDILQPLIRETAAKIATLSPEEAQTGPAIRNDSETIKNHLFLLNKHQQEIYTLLTASIQHGN